MGKMKKLIIILLLIPISVAAQDSLLNISLTKFVNHIKKYHPIAKQADMLIQRGEASVIGAKGFLDPTLIGDVNQKQFENTNYYQNITTGVKMATRLGLEIKAEYEQNQGIYLNPENKTPTNGLWNAGISMPLGNGLLIDERRAALKQAELYAEGTSYEQQNMLNDLFFDATQQYWKWVEAYHKLKIAEEALVLAEIRFVGLKKSHQFGDKPAIDTLESFIQVQNRQLNLYDYQLLYQNKTLELSTFLWTENNLPLLLNNKVLPSNSNSYKVEEYIGMEEFSNNLIEVVLNHPILMWYDIKQKQLEVDRRLKKEQFKPILNVNYNFINQHNQDNYIQQFSTQNYKWGATFKFPVLTRKAKGSVQIASLKILENQLEIDQKKLELDVKVKKFYNELLVKYNQINLLEKTVINYQKLLNAEKVKFNAGESSLFLINSRETKLIASKYKLIEVKTKYNISKAGYNWSLGNLNY
jgi:outer membrane protein TolC